MKAGAALTHPWKLSAYPRAVLTSDHFLPNALPEPGGSV